MFNHQVLNLVHKTVFSHLLTSILQNYFAAISSIHRYQTRHNKLYLTHVSTRFGQWIGLLRYKGTQLWDRLPNNLSNNTASESFRNSYKCSAVAEMGDRFATIDMGRKLGGCTHFFFWGGSWVPIEQCRLLGPMPNFVPSGILIYPAVWPQQT